MSDYTLYLDKSNKFNCKISLEGASLKSANARMILECSNKYHLFPGSIDTSGNCFIEMNQLKEFLTEKDSGNLYLEIIADDAYFKPWTSKYIVDTAKKLTVEVMLTEEASKPKITVSVETPQQKEFAKIVNETVKLLRKNHISRSLLRSKKEVFNICLAEAMSDNSFIHNRSLLITEIVKTLA